MGKIQEWGKPRPPITEKQIQLLRAFGWKYNSKGQKIGEDNHGKRPAKITFTMVDTDGNIKEFPNHSSDYCTMFHYICERDFWLSPESLKLAPFPEELPAPEKPKKSKK
jgi:hypothetical protein